ncbi:MAG: GNAT family N-acetyltransferase [Clostridia bacterium]|nr:GNAT family N-acetyltransferase [Clostridia bacterium]
MKVIIETERLILRQLEPEDAEKAFLWCSDPEVNRYLMYPLYHRAEDVRKWIEGRHPENPDNYDLAFILKETGDLFGCGGLVYRPEQDVWRLGYNIRKDMWGHGYTVEAINGIIDEVRKTRRIRVLEGEFATENFKSRRVMEKLGMIYLRDSQYEKMDGSCVYPSQVYYKNFEDNEVKNDGQ